MTERPDWQSLQAYELFIWTSKKDEMGSTVGWFRTAELLSLKMSPSLVRKFNDAPAGKLRRYVQGSGEWFIERTRTLASEELRNRSWSPKPSSNWDEVGKLRALPPPIQVDKKGARQATQALIWLSSWVRIAFPDDDELYARVRSAWLSIGTMGLRSYERHRPSTTGLVDLAWLRARAAGWTDAEALAKLAQAEAGAAELSPLRFDRVV